MPSSRSRSSPTSAATYATMFAVPSTHFPADRSETWRPRFDRPVLVGNLVSGAVWLLPALLLTLSVPLILGGAVYVAVASAFLAAVYSREVLTRGQEALAWAAPWLAAVAMCTWVLGSIDDGVSGLPWLPTLYGLVIATLCYLVWQVGALAVRQLMAQGRERQPRDS